MNHIEAILYIKTHCPYCAKVIAVLEEMGKSIPMIDVRGHPKIKQELQAKGLLLPTLSAGDQHITGSKEIILWLEENKALLANRPATERL